MTPGHKVYIVDDDETVLRSLVRLLRASELEVESFSSARVFFEKFSHSGPCCLVLDVHMPECDGIELQKQLADSGNRLPIIFITGNGDVPTCVKAMHRGAVDFLLKPFKQEVLLQRIRDCLALSSRMLARHAARSEACTRLARLTIREREVFERVITGMLNKQIASELGTSEKTVKKHRGRVTLKLGVQSVAEMLLLSQTSSDD
jgi:FixJ family two-component response regulator